MLMTRLNSAPLSGHGILLQAGEVAQMGDPVRHEATRHLSVQVGENLEGKACSCLLLPAILRLRAPPARRACLPARSIARAPAAGSAVLHFLSSLPLQHSPLPPPSPHSCAAFLRRCMRAINPASAPYPRPYTRAEGMLLTALL
mgnify:CR=1 FL=1